MLVLTRRAGEEIVIDRHIRIKVTRVKGDRVRLGIIAPVNVRVDRAEVHESRELSDAARPLHEERSAAGLPGTQQ
jgi:carbon storage regulator